jgi:hypothetical protein
VPFGDPFVRVPTAMPGELQRRKVCTLFSYKLSLEGKNDPLVAFAAWLFELEEPVGRVNLIYSGKRKKEY